MKYCPNCSAELGDQGPVPVCWNCQACFGSDPNWQPTSAPVGEFRKFTRVDAKPAQVQVPKPRRETNRWGEVGLLLFRAVFIWVLGSAVLHAFGLGEGVVLLSWALVFWVLWPVRYLIKRKGGTARDPGSAHGAQGMLDEPAPSIASGLVALFLRLLLAGGGFLLVFLLAIDSGYGDGAKALFLLAWVLLIAAPLWALAPLVRAVMRRRKAADADFNASRRD